MINLARYNYILLLLASLPLLFLISCSTQEDEVEPTFSSLWEHRFSSCGTSCHSSNASDGTELGPDLTTKSGFYTNLVNKTVNADYPAWVAVKTSDCNDSKFINPGDSDSSSLAASLIQSKSVTLAAAESCNTAFNLHAVTNDTISDLDVAKALVDWIDAGAANN